MVHALNEIRRVLIREGILIDLRPLVGRALVEIVSNNMARPVGHVNQMPDDLADDEAANRAMEEVAKRNWFVKERGAFFPIFYLWDSPNEMQKYIEEDWSDYITIEERTLKNIRSIWEVEGATAHLRITLRMLISRWKVVKE